MESSIAFQGQDVLPRLYYILIFITQLTQVLEGTLY